MFANPVHGLDPSKYRLSRIDVPVPTEQRGQGDRIWLNTLRFDDLDAEIRLGHSKVFPWGEKELEVGFDPQSLKISWLDRDRLLHLTWGTLPSEGSGNYRGEGHLVLFVQGNAVNELFRDAFQAHLAVGMGNYRSWHLDIEFDRASGILSATRTDQGSAWEPEQPATHWNYRTVWRYRVRGKKLEFIGGDKYATFDEGKCEIRRLAREVGSSTRTLARLNPGFREAPPCTIRISNRVEPYRPSMEDGVCIRDNCASGG